MQTSAWKRRCLNFWRSEDGFQSLVTTLFTLPLMILVIFITMSAMVVMVADSISNGFATSIADRSAQVMASGGNYSSVLPPQAVRVGSSNALSNCNGAKECYYIPPGCNAVTPCVVDLSIKNTIGPFTSYVKADGVTPWQGG